MPIVVIDTNRCPNRKAVLKGDVIAQPCHVKSLPYHLFIQLLLPTFEQREVLLVIFSSSKTRVTYNFTMTRNYPDQSRASQRVPLEEAQPPPYYDATAGDTFPPRYSDAEEADMGGTNGEPDISKDPGAESSDLEEAESYSDQTPSPTSRRYWRLCLVVFTLLIGLRLTIPVVAGSFSPEVSHPPS